MNRHFLAAGAIAWAAAGAHAGPFVADSISPNPDTLVAFDTAAVGINSPFATLAGNFVRGVDMDTPTTGYYVCTSPLTGSPTGFYRLSADGSSTMLSPMPVTTGSECGLTLDRSGTLLYYSQGQTGDDLLYSITTAGVFTPIAAITIPSVTGSAILGLAVHPQTGVLYGVDTTSDSLVTIDPATAAATIVGPLGVAVQFIGGMDFDNATNELFFAGDPTDTKLFRIDIATGAATLLGNMGIGCSSIASVSTAPSTCAADFNNSGSVTVQDIFDFLAAYFSNSTTADVNDSGSVTVQDIFDYLALYFAGC
jgi:hypothetical protein